ncbi:MAG: hypothetical protein KDD12_12225, partial [Lewinella sp.]|nr:hypothetical protein [Lewinella sp.]
MCPRKDAKVFISITLCVLKIRLTQNSEPSQTSIYRASAWQHQASSIKKPVSSIKHQETSIKYHASTT